MLPPDEGPPIPPPRRPIPRIGPTAADDIDRQKDTERLLAMFGPELRHILSRVRIDRIPNPIERSYLGQTIRPEGWYEPPSGGRPSRIDIAETGTFPYEDLLLQELLHAANFEYEPFVSDARRNWQGLFGPLSDAYGGRIPPSLVQDPAHAFTFGAEQSLRNAPNVPLDLYRYFLPLRQGVLTD